MEHARRDLHMTAMVRAPGHFVRAILFYVNDPALGCSIRVSAEHLAKMERKGYGMVRPTRQAW